MLFAQVDIFVASHPFCAATSFNFSSIFSQTLGTEKKNVGRTSFKVSTREPYKALGSAKYMCPPPLIIPTMSIIYAAT